VQGGQRAAQGSTRIRLAVIGPEQGSQRVPTVLLAGHRQISQQGNCLTRIDLDESASLLEAGESSR